MEYTIYFGYFLHSVRLHTHPTITPLLRFTLHYLFQKQTLFHRVGEINSIDICLLVSFVYQNKCGHIIVLLLTTLVLVDNLWLNSSKIKTINELFNIISHLSLLKKNHKSRSQNLQREMEP